jgi:hypothetical protein
MKSEPQITFGEILRSGTVDECVAATLDLMAMVDLQETDPACHRHNTHQILGTAFRELMTRSAADERLRVVENLAEHLSGYIKQGSEMRASGDPIIVVAPNELN